MYVYEYNRFDKYLVPIPAKTIVEIGCSEFLLNLASYAERTGAEVHAVTLNVKQLKAIHDALEQVNLAPFVALHLQDPSRFLLNKSWIDAAFLFDRSGLNNTLEQAKLSMSAGAALIVTRDYQYDGAWAAQFLKQQGWKIEHDGNIFSYMTRPQ